MAGATAPDVNVTIRSDALNSAADVYTAAGALKAGGILGNMTTANLKSFLPKAYNACPDCPLGYQLLVVTAPVAEITDESATAHVSGADVWRRQAGAGGVGSQRRWPLLIRAADESKSASCKNSSRRKV